MKRHTLLGLTLGIGIATLASGVAYAATGGWSQFGITGQHVTIAADRTVDGSMYLAGESVVVDGTIRGDLYCAGQSVFINGTVTGDVNCAGETVTLKGEVGDDARLAAANAHVQGSVGGDATLFAADAKVFDGAVIGGDLNGGSSTLTIDGKVEKNLRYGTSRLAIMDTVGGMVDVGAESIVMGSESRVGGDFSYGASSEQTIGNEKVAGDVRFNQVEESGHGVEGGTAYLSGVAFGFLTLLVTGMALALVAPRFLARTYKIASANIVKTILAGIITVFVAPIVTVVLALSVIGLPLAAAVLLAWISVMIVSTAFFAYMVGSWLMAKSNNVLVRMLAGVVIVAIALSIPFVNILVGFVALVVGSGAIVCGLTKGYRTPKYTVEL